LHDFRALSADLLQGGEDTSDDLKDHGDREFEDKKDPRDQDQNGPMNVIQPENIPVDQPDSSCCEEKGSKKRHGKDSENERVAFRIPSSNKRSIGKFPVQRHNGTKKADIP
jgi:hypothetical protein